MRELHAKEALHKAILTLSAHTALNNDFRLASESATCADSGGTSVCTRETPINQRFPDTWALLQGLITKHYPPQKQTAPMHKNQAFANQAIRGARGPTQNNVSPRTPDPAPAWGRMLISAKAPQAVMHDLDAYSSAPPQSAGGGRLAR